MFRSLYSKLSAAMLVLFAILTILMVTVVIYATDMYRQEVIQKLNIDVAENIVKEKILIRNGKIDREALEYIFHNMMVINPSIELYLLDPEGNILEYSAAPGKVKRARISLSPIQKWLSDSITMPLLGDDPRNPTREKVFSVFPIHQQDKLEGYLYIILGGEKYDTIAQKIHNSFILQMTGWVIVATIACAGIISLLIFALLTRRLRKLTAGMNAFNSKGNISDIDLPRGGKSLLPGDEVDHLSKTFREMAKQIEEQIAKLQKNDLMRRELVANVSHDLRTPLATLTAYIETMQIKETGLSKEERQKYLQVAGKQCRRLRTLVDDLFELASLEAEETKLHTEPFNIAELIQDVVQNYELAAEKKKITLTSNIGQNNSVVIADIRLVERVLENLISNALRHTPEDGTVSIILKPEDKYINVQVLNTGSGIPEEALPHIFERFYTIENNESTSEAPNGLGLAIAKRIMDLHGSGIDVASDPHAGTCFTIRFPIHSIS